MDSDGLRTFVTVHRAGGFSQAAGLLLRSQPAISRRIALLEQELGASLFDRAAGGAALSQAGQVLLPYAERALAAIEDARGAVSALATEDAGPVSLVVVGTLAGDRLTSALARFRRDHPRVDLALRTATSAEVSALVRGGEAHLGLRYHHDPSPDLEARLVTMESLVVVCAAGHPLAGRPVAALADLRAERWLAFPDSGGRREIAATHIFALFLTRGMGDVAWTAIDSLTAQKRLAAAGFGLALMPRSDVDEELESGQLGVIGVGDLDAAQPVVAVVRRNGFLSRAARTLLEDLGGWA
ncbi:MAG: LysR family transcriptional regulator [Phenylobacterium sp.]|uniref:LysR family transcriptional regulator n=1 Tax=Phenylobacterium sp. TaxID=1871053 RepID=UPI0027351D0B|nr:LysR family transcriptional regulator [Phenylobacterium sp.]MDP3749157.1 LysR family transcriptional regulator [Phenylobacterium sp.]